jgi:hypothetical protein
MTIRPSPPCGRLTIDRSRPTQAAGVCGALKTVQADPGPWAGSSATLSRLLGMSHAEVFLAGLHAASQRGWVSLPGRPCRLGREFKPDRSGPGRRNPADDPGQRAPSGTRAGCHCRGFASAKEEVTPRSARGMTSEPEPGTTTFGRRGGESPGTRIRPAVASRQGVRSRIDPSGLRTVTTSPEACRRAIRSPTTTDSRPTAKRRRSTAAAAEAFMALEASIQCGP